jgi:hypothetical protein
LPSSYDHIRDVVEPAANAAVFGQLTSFSTSQVGLPLRYVMVRISINTETYRQWLRQKNYAYWRSPSEPGREEFMTQGRRSVQWPCCRNGRTGCEHRSSRSATCLTNEA